jgi:hypothetical protein
VYFHFVSEIIQKKKEQPRGSKSQKGKHKKEKLKKRKEKKTYTNTKLSKNYEKALRCLVRRKKMPLTIR